MSRSLRVVLPGLAVAAVVVGIVLVVRAETLTTSSGWFAYAPLSGTTFTPDAFLGQTRLGAVLIGAGLAAGAFAIGRRRATSGRRGRILLAVALAAAAIVVGAGLLVWNATRFLVGWHDAGSARDVFSIVMTKRQFDGLAPWQWLSPAVVGTALVIAGVAVLAFVVGRRFAGPAARPAAPPTGPSSEFGSDPGA